MNKILFILVILSVHLALESRIAQSINNVDLIIEDKFNDQGENYGDEFFIHNRNDIPIQVSIKVVNSLNAKDNILKNTVIIESLEQISAGSVTMDDPTQESHWSYELKVKPN
jgi:hypothetical protein